MKIDNIIKKELIRLYRTYDLNECLREMLKLDETTSFSYIYNFLKELAKISKNTTYDVDKTKNELKTIVGYQKYIKFIKNNKNIESFKGNYCSTPETCQQEIEKNIQIIAKEYYQCLNNSINCMSISELIDYVFNNENKFNDEQILNFLHNYSLSNDLLFNFSSEKLNNIIMNILESNKILNTSSVSANYEEKLKNIISNNKIYLKKYLNHLEKEKKSRQSQTDKLSENNKIIYKYVSCYKINGIKETLNQLFSSSSNLKEDFLNVISKIYILNNLKIEDIPDYENLISKLELIKKNTKLILKYSKSYKGEISSLEYKKLEQNDFLYKDYIEQLSTLINNDLKKKSLNIRSIILKDLQVSCEIDSLNNENLELTNQIKTLTNQIKFNKEKIKTLSLKRNK